MEIHYNDFSEIKTKKQKTLTLNLKAAHHMAGDIG